VEKGNKHCVVVGAIISYAIAMRSTIAMFSSSADGRVCLIFHGSGSGDDDEGIRTFIRKAIYPPRQAGTVGPFQNPSRVWKWSTRAIHTPSWKKSGISSSYCAHFAGMHACMVPKPPLFLHRPPADQYVVVIADTSARRHRAMHG
jgi:hypothetical protein